MPPSKPGRRIPKIDRADPPKTARQTAELAEESKRHTAAFLSTIAQGTATPTTIAEYLRCGDCYPVIPNLVSSCPSLNYPLDNPSQLPSRFPSAPPVSADTLASFTSIRWEQSRLMASAPETGPSRLWQRWKADRQRQVQLMQAEVASGRTNMRTQAAERRFVAEVAQESVMCDAQVWMRRTVLPRGDGGRSGRRYLPQLDEKEGGRREIGGGGKEKGGSGQKGEGMGLEGGQISRNSSSDS